MELNEILESYKPQAKDYAPNQSATPKYKGLHKLEESQYKGGTGIMYWM